jgi:hypothetical protein
MSFHSLTHIPQENKGEIYKIPTPEHPPNENDSGITEDVDPYNGTFVCQRRLQYLI